MFSTAHLSSEQQSGNNLRHIQFRRKHAGGKAAGDVTVKKASFGLANKSIANRRRTSPRRRLAVQPHASEVPQDILSGELVKDGRLYGGETTVLLNRRLMLCRESGPVLRDRDHRPDPATAVKEPIHTVDHVTMGKGPYGP
jgi:hypothetical protein